MRPDQRVQIARPPHEQALQRVIERRFAADLARKHPGTAWSIVDSPLPTHKQPDRVAVLLRPSTPATREKTG